MSELPSSKTLTRHAKDLGKETWDEYKNLRESYKSKGLTPREAIERAAIELDLMKKWQAWHERKVVGKALGANVPLTTDEIKQVAPEYVPPTATKAESVGEEVLTFAEEVLWARDKRAVVENGGEPPKHFPCPGALSWYQFALVNRDKFMQHVAAVSKPASDGENAYMQDGQYQYKEITRQLEQALAECGEKMVELEGGFVEMLNAQTT